MLETILLISPLIIGAVVAAVNANAITNALNKFRAWLSRKREDYSQRPGKISRYFLTPSFSSFLKVKEWFDSFLTILMIWLLLRRKWHPEISMNHPEG